MGKIIAQFATHFRRSPDQLGRAQIREYLLHLIRLGRAWDTRNQARRALHFLYPDFPDHLGVWAGDLRRNAGNPSVSDASLPE